MSVSCLRLIKFLDMPPNAVMEYGPRHPPDCGRLGPPRFSTCVQIIVVRTSLVKQPPQDAWVYRKPCPRTVAATISENRSRAHHAPTCEERTPAFVGARSAWVVL